MSSFNSLIEKLFPQTQTFVDFSGTRRIFDIYVCELSADDYTIVAKDLSNPTCNFEVRINSDPQKALAQLKIEIVEYIRAPFCQARFNEGTIDIELTNVLTPNENCYPSNKSEQLTHQ